MSDNESGSVTVTASATLSDDSTCPPLPTEYYYKHLPILDWLSLSAVVSQVRQWGVKRVSVIDRSASHSLHSFLIHAISSVASSTLCLGSL